MMEVDSTTENGLDSTGIASQAKRLKELLNKPLSKGDKWYVIDAKWWGAFEEYMGLSGSGKAGKEEANPGPITNTSLLKPHNDNETGSLKLKENIVEDLDYQLLPEEAWKILKEQFRLQSPEDEIERYVIESGMYTTSTTVELHFLDLNLALANAEAEAVKISLSRASNFVALIKKAKQMLELGEDDIRLYLKHEENKYEELDLVKTMKDKRRLQDYLSPNQLLVFDIKDQEGNWRLDSLKLDVAQDEGPSSSSAIPLPPPAPPISTATGVTATTSNENSLFGRSSGVPANSFTLRSGNSYGKSMGESGSKETVPRGLCGLQNIGNTCFMNSALQCLSNCPQLTNYFLKGTHEAEINETNPLGMQGRLASAYADLIQKLWSGSYGSFIPRDFKWVVGQFAPQFSGYHQQDSQELMSFLLDGLHEDLNRIKKKPYIELKEGDGRADDTLAKEAWKDYKLRNDSIIVDCFHGQLKSTLVCPVCDKVSVKFDPFCYLSLPLPANRRSIEVLFIPANPQSKWRKYRLTVPKHGKVADLQAALEEKTSIPSKKVVFVDVTQHRAYKLYLPKDSVSNIMERDDIFAYELNDDIPAEQDPVVVCVYQRYERKYGGMNMSYASSTWNLDGAPILFRSPAKELTYQQLHKRIKARLQGSLADLPDENSLWWNEDGDDSGVEENGSSPAESVTHSSLGTDPPVFGMEISTTVDETGDSTQNLEENSERIDVVGEAEATVNQKEEGSVGKRAFFQLSLINTYGSTTIEVLKPNNPEPVDPQRTNGVGEHKLLYVGVDWDSVAYEKFFTKDFSAECEQDESMNVRNKRTVTLDKCLNLFTQKEKLGENDLWYCPQCKDHRQASKQMDLWTLPQLLIVHLKRFSYTRYWRDKIEDFVEFPTKNLDMGPWLPNGGKTGPPAIYDLIGVSNHMGGLGGGHYTAYAMNDMEKRWYNYDDSFVGRSSEEDVVSKSAYVLFYLRRERVEEPNIEMETSD